MIVGVAGLGSRGRAIGNRLRTTGRRVLGFDDDVRAAASSGLRTAGSSERLAQECEVELVSCDGEQAERLIRELLEFEGITSLTTIALCGALEPRRVQHLAEASAARGIALVDAPLDGGEDAIQAGRAIVFAGGSEPAVESCRSLLEVFGSLVYVGEAGSGQIARTVNDLLRWSNVLAVHDAFSLVRAAGADPSLIRDAVLRASGSNRALEEWGRAGVSGARQDIQAALMLAGQTGASVPFLDQLDSLLERLDPDKMAGLFNLGIVDLSPHGAEGSGFDQPEAQPDMLAFGEPEAELDELGFGEVGAGAPADFEDSGTLLEPELEGGELEPPSPRANHPLS
ncbi:MAG TPA: NAD(P)-binding domain-containing protein [Chloroflexota bacterium]|nr:NAD(P)-binding domain-containing protein [Chloroflexota bacterium]